MTTYERLRYIDDLNEHIKPLLVDKYQVARYQAFLDGIDWVTYECVPGAILEFGVASGVTSLFLTLARHRCLGVYAAPFPPAERKEVEAKEEKEEKEEKVGGDKLSKTPSSKICSIEWEDDGAEVEVVGEKGRKGEIIAGGERKEEKVEAKGELSSEAIDILPVVAFDSFEGLPENTHPRWPKGIFKNNRSTGHPTLAVDEPVTEEKILQMFDKCELPRPTLVKGYFSETIPRTLGTAHKPGGVLNITAAALVHIDCDLYESCKDVLYGIKHLLQQGTLIYFDDWNNYKGDRSKGERRAVREFLEENKDIEFEEHLSYTAFCKSFIVHREPIRLASLALTPPLIPSLLLT